MPACRCCDHGQHRFGHRKHDNVYYAPLSMIRLDEEVCVREIHGGLSLRRRLADLGLSIGAVIRVVHSGDPCQLIVSVKEDSRLALGRGIAHRIMVEPIEIEEEDD